jgi:hypothetical protein
VCGTHAFLCNYNTIGEKRREKVKFQNISKGCENAGDGTEQNSVEDGSYW